jgi:hypothetical protein
MLAVVVGCMLQAAADTVDQAESRRQHAIADQTDVKRLMDLTTAKRSWSMAMR